MFPAFTCTVRVFDEDVSPLHFFLIVARVHTLRLPAHTCARDSLYPSAPRFELCRRKAPKIPQARHKQGDGETNYGRHPAAVRRVRRVFHHMCNRHTCAQAHIEQKWWRGLCLFIVESIYEWRSKSTPATPHFSPSFCLSATASDSGNSRIARCHTRYLRWT